MIKAVREINGRMMKGSIIMARPSFRANKPFRYQGGTRRRDDRWAIRNSREGKMFFHNQDLRSWIDEARSNRGGLLDGQWRGVNIIPSLEWKRKLFRSILIDLERPMDFNMLNKEIMAFWGNQKEILPLSRRKLLVEFGSEYECALAREKAQKDEKILPFVTSWGANKGRLQCQNRLTWIELRGMPIMAWEHSNIFKIAEELGKPQQIVLGSETCDFFFEVAVLIKTSILEPIKRKILVKIDGGEEYDILVVENSFSAGWGGEMNTLPGKKVWDRDWPKLDDACNSQDSVGDRHERQRHDALGACRSGVDTSLGQSIDLNRSPKQALDLDPSWFRAGVDAGEGIEVNLARDLNEEVVSNLESCRVTHHTTIRSEENRSLDSGIRLVDSELVQKSLNRNHQNSPSEGGVRNANPIAHSLGERDITVTNIFGDDEGRSGNQRVISNAERDVEVARLINLPIGDVEILSKELREGIERRESMPVIWEAEENVEENVEEDEVDDIAEEVESVRLRKNKSKGKKKVKKIQSLRGKCCQAVLEQLESNAQPKNMSALC